MSHDAEIEFRTSLRGLIDYYTKRGLDPAVLSYILLGQAYALVGDLMKEK